MADDLKTPLRCKKEKQRSSLTRAPKNLSKLKLACIGCGVEFFRSSRSVADKFCTEKCMLRSSASASPAEMSVTHSAMTTPQDTDNPISAKYKTQLCVHFESRGLCSYGNQCAFAHGNSELQQKVRTAREKNNAFSKSPRTHQKMGQHYSSIHKGGKGSKGGKGVTGGSRSNGSNRNQNYYGGSGAGENISNGTNSSDDSTADGSTPRHSKTKVSYQTAAFFAAPSEPVGRLGNGWNECMGNLGDGWGEASQQDVIFTPPVPRELCMLPKQGIQDEGKSFFDLKSARGIQIPNGEEYVMARNNSEPIETYYYSNEQKAGWFSKASPSATHRSEETSVPLHHAGSPLELPPPNMSFPSAVERHNGHEHRHSADVSGGIPSEVSPVGDMGSIFSRMGLQGQFALGQDDGGVDVEAFALGILGGPGFGGLNYGFEGGKY